MNNKELVIDVFKHPLIQEILKRKIVESSVINRLIIEETLNELGAPLEKWKQKITAALDKNPELRWLDWGRPAKKEMGDDQWTELVKDLNNHFQSIKNKAQPSPEQDQLILYIDAYRKRLAAARVSDYEVSDRAKAAVSLALTPLTIFKVAVG